MNIPLSASSWSHSVYDAEAGGYSPPDKAKAYLIWANLSERTIVFMEINKSLIRLELYNSLSTKKMAIFVQKHLSTSTSLCAKFLTASLILAVIRAESLQPP